MDPSACSSLWFVTRYGKKLTGANWSAGLLLHRQDEAIRRKRMVNFAQRFAGETLRAFCRRWSSNRFLRERLCANVFAIIWVLDRLVGYPPPPPHGLMES